MAIEEFSITQTAATLAALLDVAAPTAAAPAAGAVLDAAAAAFGRPGCDRVFVYNPDAIARWLWESRPELDPVRRALSLTLPLRTVFPPVTPVCFASMYAGVAPALHGINSYTKPVLTVDTLFDRAPAAGVPTAIVSTAGDSISKIFLGRSVDYYIYDTPAQCNQKALELVREKRHRLIVLYNGNYDYHMHRWGPEGRRALAALSANADTFLTLSRAIERDWADADSTLVFAPDHGCHKKLRFFGSHGIDADCDMHTVQGYRFFPAR